MALHPCQECRSPISTSAQACPNCGCTDPFGFVRSDKRRQLWGMLIVAFIMMMLSLAFKSGWISLPTLRQ